MFCWWFQFQGRNGPSVAKTWFVQARGVQFRFGLGSVLRSEVPEQPRFTRLVLGENEVRKKELNEVRMFSNGAGTRGSWGQVRFGYRLGFSRNGSGLRGSSLATAARK